MVQPVRDQLFFSGFSSEVKPLSSQRTGSELQQQPAGLRSEGAVWFSTESNLWTGDSEVRHHVSSFKAGVFNQGSVAPWWSATALQGVREIRFDISTHFQITLEYREKYLK